MSLSSDTVVEESDRAAIGCIVRHPPSPKRNCTEAHRVITFHFAWHEACIMHVRHTVPMAQTPKTSSQPRRHFVYEGLRFCCAVMRLVAISNWNKTASAGFKA